MTAPVSRPFAHTEQLERLRWLPARSHVNGLDDVAWAPALEVSRQIVPAERALITAMPNLVREAARQGGTAWR
jgi:hypothetical protein